jgi:hypothetical protein
MSETGIIVHDECHTFPLPSGVADTDFQTRESRVWTCSVTRFTREIIMSCDEIANSRHRSRLKAGCGPAASLPRSAFIRSSARSASKSQRHLPTRRHGSAKKLWINRLLRHYYLGSVRSDSSLETGCPANVARILLLMKEPEVSNGLSRGNRR